MPFVLPSVVNPHLLISRNTATTTRAVGTFRMDPLHLAHVFSLGAKTSLRYTAAGAVSAGAHESHTC